MPKLTVKQMLERLGYQHVQTGGGCTAWQLETEHVVIMVTSDEGITAPMDMETATLVGVYGYADFWDQSKSPEGAYTTYDRFGDITLYTLSGLEYEKEETDGT